MKTLTFSLLMLSSVSAFAIGGTIKAKLTMTDVVQVSIASGKPGEYQMKTNTARNVSDVYGTGMLASLDEKKDETTVQTVGESVQGQVSTSVAVTDATQGLVTVSQVMDLQTGDVRLNGFYDAQAKIVSGTWDGYLAGETLTVEFTTEGVKAYREEQTQMLVQGLTSAFRKKFGSMASVTDSQVGIVEDDETGRCELNLQAMTCRNPSLRVKALFQISLF